ncbi:MAG: hypothetical protein GY927_07865 [bacterium]|nr:hypothetical protein [bacterium]
MEEKYTQKYTPRKKNSVWSKKNKARVSKMIRQGRMTEAMRIKLSYLLIFIDNIQECSHAGRDTSMNERKLACVLGGG